MYTFIRQSSQLELMNPAERIVYIEPFSSLDRYVSGRNPLFFICSPEPL
jgi:hypothetical protein